MFERSGGISQADADARYLQLTGGTLTGNLRMAQNEILDITRLRNDAGDLTIKSDNNDIYLEAQNSQVNLTDGAIDLNGDSMSGVDELNLISDLFMNNGVIFLDSAEDMSIYKSGNDLIMNNQNTLGQTHISGNTAVQLQTALAFRLLVSSSQCSIGEHLKQVSLLYGSIQCIDGSASQTLTNQNQWYQVTQFTANGSADGEETRPNHTSDLIQIGRAGTYLIGFDVSFNGDINEDYEIMVKKNNGATDLDVKCSRQIGGVADIGSASASNIISSVAQNDTIELWVRCISGAGKTFDIDQANLKVMMVGF